MQITQNKQNKLNPDSVASYDLRPGNGVGLLWLVEKGKGWTKEENSLGKANEKRKMGKVEKSKR